MFVGGVEEVIVLRQKVKLFSLCWVVFCWSEDLVLGYVIYVVIGRFCVCMCELQYVCQDQCVVGYLYGCD